MSFFFVVLEILFIELLFIELLFLLFNKFSKIGDVEFCNFGIFELMEGLEIDCGVWYLGGSCWGVGKIVLFEVMFGKVGCGFKKVCWIWEIWIFFWVFILLEVILLLFEFVNVG